MKAIYDVPEPLSSFLMYIENIQGKSQKTAQSYFYDLRAFYKFLKWKLAKVSDDIEFEQIEIYDVDMSYIKSVDLNLIYEYMNFLNLHPVHAKLHHFVHTSNICINQVFLRKTLQQSLRP